MMANEKETPWEWVKEKGKKLKKRPKLLVGLVVVVIVLVSLISWAGYNLVVKPKKKKELNTLTVSAQPQLEDTAFPSDKSITVSVYNKDQEAGPTATLTGPGWRESFRGLDYTDYFYVQASTDGWYWNYLKSSYPTEELSDGTVALKVGVESSKMTIGTQFVRQSSIRWTYAENETGLGDGVNSTVTVSEEFEMANYSAFKDLTLKFTVNNTTVEFSSIDFNGESYTPEDWNTTVSGNTTTYMINVTDAYYYNKGKAENRSITIKGTEDLNVNETVKVETWFKSLDVGLAEDSYFVTPKQALYFKG